MIKLIPYFFYLIYKSYPHGMLPRINYYFYEKKNYRNEFFFLIKFTLRSSISSENRAPYIQYTLCRAPFFVDIILIKDFFVNGNFTTLVLHARSCCYYYYFHLPFATGLYTPDRKNWKLKWTWKVFWINAKGLVTKNLESGLWLQDLLYQT